MLSLPATQTLLFLPLLIWLLLLLPMLLLLAYLHVVSYVEWQHNATRAVCVLGNLASDKSTFCHIALLSGSLTFVTCMHDTSIRWRLFVVTALPFLSPGRNRAKNVGSNELHTEAVTGKNKASMMVRRRMRRRLRNLNAIYNVPDT